MENNSTINQNIQQLEKAIQHITRTIDSIFLMNYAKQFNNCKTIQQSLEQLNIKKKYTYLTYQKKK